MIERQTICIPNSILILKFCQQGTKFIIMHEQPDSTSYKQNNSDLPLQRFPQSFLCRSWPRGSWRTWACRTLCGSSSSPTPSPGPHGCRQLNGGHHRWWASTCSVWGREAQSYVIILLYQSDCLWMLHDSIYLTIHCSLGPRASSCIWLPNEAGRSGMMLSTLESMTIERHADSN